MTTFIQRIVIIDEDKKMGDHIAAQLATYPSLQVAMVATAISKIDTYIYQVAPHIVILETCYRHITGIEVAQYLNQRYPWLIVVFITKHSQYALAAFELKVIDYLVHPVSPERLKKMVRKIQVLQDERLATPVLHLKVLGDVKVINHQFMPIKMRTKKAVELLCFLWHSGEHAPSRDIIIEALWPEYEVKKAVELLHSTLYQLRQTLKVHGYTKAIIVRNKRYQLVIKVVTDSDRLLHVLSTAPYEQASVDTVLSLCQGDYFEERGYLWAETKRQVIRQQLRYYFLRALQKDIAPSSKVQIAQQLRDWHYYDEACILELMRYYSETKQRDKIIEVYQDASCRVREELGIDLAKEVDDMYGYYLVVTPKV